MVLHIMLSHAAMTVSDPESPRCPDVGMDSSDAGKIGKSGIRVPISTFPGGHWHSGKLGLGPWADFNPISLFGRHSLSGPSLSSGGQTSPLQLSRTPTDWAAPGGRRGASLSAVTHCQTLSGVSAPHVTLPASCNWGERQVGLSSRARPRPRPPGDSHLLPPARGRRRAGGRGRDLVPDPYPDLPGAGSLPRPRPRFVRNRGRSPVPVPDSRRGARALPGDATGSHPVPAGAKSSSRAICRGPFP
jgi:hypothetical protein